MYNAWATMKETLLPVRQQSIFDTWLVFLTSFHYFTDYRCRAYWTVVTNIMFPFSHYQTIATFSVSVYPLSFSNHISLPPLHWRSCPAISLSPCISRFSITTFQDVFQFLCQCPYLCTIEHNLPYTTLIHCILSLMEYFCLLSLSALIFQHS